MCININGMVYSEFKMGSALEDQQLGCLWQGPHMLSVSLAGYINYLDINNPNKPLKILKVKIMCNLLIYIINITYHRVKVQTSTLSHMLQTLCMLVVWMVGSVSSVSIVYVCVCVRVCVCVCVCWFLDLIPCHWGVESGEIDLVSGPGHTNNICCLQATSENILSLGLDKKLKKTSLATNEFWLAVNTYHYYNIIVLLVMMV